MANEKSSQPIPAGAYHIFSRSSGCAVDSPDKKDKGVVLTKKNFSGQQRQTFYLHPMDDGYYMIESMHSGLYWDIQNNKQDNGAKVWLWPKHSKANQRFRIDVVGDGLVRFAAKHSGKVVDLSNDGTIHQWHYHGGHNQLWRILKPML